MSTPKRKSQIALHKIGFLAPIDAPNTTIQVFVKDLKNKTLTLSIPKDAPVLALKEQIAQKTGLPIDQQRLHFAGKQLENQHSIQVYNIQQESNLHLSLRLKGGVGERETIQEFIQAEIVHGNVRTLTTPESFLAVDIIRDDKHKEPLEAYNKLLENLNLKEAYKDNPTLVDMCVQSMLVERLQGGNCFEMAYWAAVKLIENTQNQYIYVCCLDGRFPLPPTVDINDATHPLYRKDKDKVIRVDNYLDHVMVITYPTDTPLEDMDLNRATVVDAWYDNLVCSLGEYLNREHPYYNYEYSNTDTFQLEIDTNIKVMDKHVFQAIGTPFSDNKETAKMAPSMNVLVNLIAEEAPVTTLPYNVYEFDDNKTLRDLRTTAELEYLLIEAMKKGGMERELASFKEVEEFDVLLQSTNAAFLKAVARTLVGLEGEVLENFYTSMEKLPPALNNLFVPANAPLIERFVEHAGDGFSQFLLQFFNNLDPDKQNVFNTLPTAALQQYALGSIENFKEVVTMKGIFLSSSKVLQSMTEEDWEILSQLEEIEDAEALIYQLMIKTNKNQKSIIFKVLSPTQTKTFALKSKANFERVMMADAGQPFLDLLAGMKAKEWATLWGYYHQNPSNSLINELLELTEGNPLILQGLSEERFKSYSLRDTANFERVAEMQEVKPTFTELLHAMKSEEWKKLWERYSFPPSNELLNHLLDLTKNKASLLEHLSDSKWKEYVLASAHHLNRVMEIEELEQKLSNLLTELKAQEWEALDKNYPHLQGKKKLVEQLTKMNLTTGKLAESKLLPKD